MGRRNADGRRIRNVKLTVDELAAARAVNAARQRDRRACESATQPRSLMTRQTLAESEFEIELNLETNPTDEQVETRDHANGTRTTVASPDEDCGYANPSGSNERCNVGVDDEPEGVVCMPLLPCDSISGVGVDDGAGVLARLPLLRCETASDVGVDDGTGDMARLPLRLCGSVFHVGVDDGTGVVVRTPL
jgi:hypothetical protein